ncbi:unnamed protein product, partial [Musa banksii]
VTKQRASEHVSLLWQVGTLVSLAADRVILPFAQVFDGLTQIGYSFQDAHKEGYHRRF